MYEDDVSAGSESNAVTSERIGRYPWTDGESPSMTIVDAVAATTGLDPLDLPPLQRYVDTDALNTLVENGESGDGAVLNLSFWYGGLEIVADSVEGVEVRPATVVGE